MRIWRSLQSGPKIWDEGDDPVTYAPDVAAFRKKVDANFKTWEQALHALPRGNIEQQLHVGRCFQEFRTFFSGTKGWKLFFIRSAERDDAEGLSERSVGMMMAAAQLMDWAVAETDAGHLVGLIREIMQRGQNYGMYGLASIQSLPQRYWRPALDHLKRVGDERKTRQDYEWRERSWRLAAMGQDVLAALATLERPGRTITMMLDNPKGYDRIVADAIFSEHGDEKRIATITVRKVMKFLSEEIGDVTTEVDRIRSEQTAAEINGAPDLVRIKNLVDLPEDKRRIVMENIAAAITKYYETK